MSPGKPYRKQPKAVVLKTLGDRIRETRKAWDWTQAKFAEHLCTNQRTVSAWECGTHEPPKAVQAAIAKLFRISLEALLAKEFSIPDLPEAFDDSRPQGAAEGTGRHLDLPPIPAGSAVMKMNRYGLAREALPAKGALLALQEALEEGRPIWIVVG